MFPTGMKDGRAYIEHSNRFHSKFDDGLVLFRILAVGGYLLNYSPENKLDEEKRILCIRCDTAAEFSPID
jgi:hypothetical protein